MSSFVSSPASWLVLLAALAFGYALGSIPFGLILTRLAGLGDIRKIGSGNIGATNVLRTGNYGLAAATLLLDGLKGFLAAIIAWHAAGPYAALAAALGAVLGHLFPVWLGFKGGKGMATALGALLGVAPVICLIACATWLAVAWIFRMSSLATLLALAIATAVAWTIGLAAPFGLTWSSVPVAILASIITVLVFARHHENIARLRAGTEPRIGSGGKATSA